MVALRKDVKVGLTVGAIVVAVVGVYAGLSALAGNGSAAKANGSGEGATASLQTASPAGASKTNGGNAKPAGPSVADRTVKPADAIKLPTAAGGGIDGSGSPAVANPDGPLASGNRKPGQDPWDTAFASGRVEPAITVTPEPGKPAGTSAADRDATIRALTGKDAPVSTANANEPSGAVAGGGTSSTLTRAGLAGSSQSNDAKPGDQTHLVVPGETFSAISAEYYGDAKYVKLILDANPSVNPNKLKPGTSIRIPAQPKGEAAMTGSPSTRPAGGATSAAAAKVDPTKQYVVKSGDSLHKIASELYNDISYATKIYDANKSTIGADPAKLKVGMVLTLPEAPKKK